MTPDQARSKQREQLREAIAQLRTSEGWKRWLKVRQSFHRYSLRNSWLIALQFPTATMVRGYHQWRKDFHRQVRAGEKAIWILAPMSRKITDEHDNDTGERKVFFRSVKVFDVSQTNHIPGEDEIPLAPPTSPITGDSHADWIPALIDHAATLGYDVAFDQELPPGAEGYCDHEAKHIVVNHEAPPNAQVRILVHELAHAHGITYRDYARAEAETMAEAAAFIACGAIGLDTSGEAVPYIAGWDESAEETIEKACKLIDRISKAISECRTSEAPAPAGASPQPAHQEG